VNNQENTLPEQTTQSTFINNTPAYLLPLYLFICLHPALFSS
jgi:hypothetical protein